MEVTALHYAVTDCHHHTSQTDGQKRCFLWSDYPIIHDIHQCHCLIIFCTNCHHIYVTQSMNILGIETSCDETSVAIVQDGTIVLSNALASSAPSHVKTGGIVPEVGARQQIKAIIPMIAQAMDEFTADDINAIAVTVGPGLIGSLIVGVETAKTLSWAWQKPLIPVDHVVAHVYANWLHHEIPQLPALGLIISGGHTEFILIKDHGKIEFLGGTRDDAVGEAYDKVARLLGLPYPGGPEIDKLAVGGDANQIILPRPMIADKSAEMSLSGLKNAVRLAVEAQQKTNNPQWKANVAASFQQAIIDVLTKKTHYLLEEHQPKSLIIAGGVAASPAIREAMHREFDARVAVYVSQRSLSVDNAAIIASYAYFNYQPQTIEEIAADPLYHARHVGTSRKKKLTK